MLIEANHCVALAHKTMHTAFSKMSRYFFNQVFSEQKVKQTSTKPNQTLEAVVETW